MKKSILITLMSLFIFACPVCLALGQEPTSADNPSAKAEGTQTFLIAENGTKEFVDPEYKAFVKENKKSKHYVKLKQTYKSSSEWLDTEAWLKNNGFNKPELNRTEDGYTYEGTVRGRQYEYMYTVLAVTDPNGKKTVYDFSGFGRFGYPSFIFYALVKDNILYVSIAHNTYYDSNKDTAFILALEPDTGKILWRSKTRICNANNFVILDDTIVCGYGFTSEPDALYTIDIYSGKVREKIPVKSGPDYIIKKDNTLRVATYNTDYTFSYK